MRRLLSRPRGLRGWRLGLAALALGGWTATTPAAAQDISVPVEVQVPLLLKILTFDRTLAAESHDSLVVGVVFQSHYRASAAISDEVCRALATAGRNLNAGRVLRVVRIDLDDPRNLGAALLREGVRVLYVTPLRAVATSAVAAATRERQVVSMTGVVRYVEEGLAVAVDANGERPQIVINLAASRAEGAVFAGQLLKLARLTGPEVSRP
jgi:hypothetical protein